MRIEIGRCVRLFALLALVLVVPAAAWAEGSCGQRIQGPATLLGVFVAEGEPLPGGEVRGYSVTLEGGFSLEDGQMVPIGANILSGVLVNAGPLPLSLVFSTGATATLAAGEAVAVGNATCECRCTCKTATGASKGATFPCSSNADTCKYDGDICQFSDGTHTRTGTYSGCIKVWVVN
jgi:hypothetical protein